jgi:pyruvate kinase
MLSAESATGLYPREAVAMMSRIIESTERHKGTSNNDDFVIGFPAAVA